MSDAADLSRLMNKLAGFPITVEPVPLGPIKQLDVVSEGMTSFPAMIEIVKPRPAQSADPTNKPRLYANVSVLNPGFIAVGNGPVTKLGVYRLKVEIENKGKAAANKVRISVTGVGAITKLGTIAAKEKVRTYFIDLASRSGTWWTRHRDADAPGHSTTTHDAELHYEQTARVATANAIALFSLPIVGAFKPK